MTSPLNQLDEHLQASVDTPTDTTRRARIRFFNRIENNHRRAMIQWCAAASTLAISALLIVTQVSPSTTPTPPLSFLQSAQASYADMRAKGVEMGNNVRHLVQTVTYSGVDNPNTQRYEVWQNAEGSRALTTTDGTFGAPPESLFLNGDTYLPKAFIQPVVNGLDGATGAYAYQGGLNIAVLEGHHPVSLPDNLNGQGMIGSPDYPGVICYRFDEKSSEQLAQEAYLAKLQTTAGFDPSIPGSPEKTIELLMSGQKDGYVEDLGERVVDGVPQHIFRVQFTVKTDDHFDETRIIDFGFDPEEYTLKSMHSENIYADTDIHEHYVILVDELIDPSLAPVAYHDPSAANLLLQEVSDITNGQTVYPITEQGCYRDTDEGVERLSPDEEAEVLASTKRPNRRE